MAALPGREGCQAGIVNYIYSGFFSSTQFALGIPLPLAQGQTPSEFPGDSIPYRYYVHRLGCDNIDPLGPGRQGIQLLDTGSSEPLAEGNAYSNSRCPGIFVNLNTLKEPH